MTQLLSNYNRHLKTRKHIKNVEKCGKNVENVEIVVEKKNEHSQIVEPFILFSKKESQNVCNFCSKNFSRSDSLKRHLSVCKLVKVVKQHQKAPNSTEEKTPKEHFQCNFCNQLFSRNYSLNRHYERCKLALNNKVSKENELEKQLLRQELRHKQEMLEQKQELIQQKDQTIQIAKQSKQIIHNHTTNKTINYLNTTYGNMIAMDQFLYNLEHTVQLTQEERQKLLMSYKDSGIELFARSFSHIMKENCKRQLLKEGLPEMNLIPLYCSDGNLRSHKEKSHQGWNTCYDDQSLNKMINISSDQVYQSYQKSLMIFGKERNKVFKQIKQDNHSQKDQKLNLLKNK